MRTVLALCGKRFSGKDSFYRCLEQSSTRSLCRFAFADQAKSAFVRQWNASHVQPELQVNLQSLLTDRACKETWRPHLTAFVTEALAKDSLVFCRELIAAAQQTPPTHVLVITDLRLKLELAELKKHFQVHVVRIERLAENKRASGWVPAQADDHFTETELDDPSYWSTVVHNDSSLAALASHAHIVLTSILSSNADKS